MNDAAVNPATPTTITGPDQPTVSFINSWLAGKTKSTTDNYRGDLAQFGRWLGRG